jgi:hypothetical protein
MGQQAKDLSELVSYFKLEEQEKEQSIILLEAQTNEESLSGQLEHKPGYQNT